MAPSSSKYVWHIDYHELVIEQLIGQGAFGQVFKGKWNGTPVAIKKLLPEVDLLSVTIWFLPNICSIRLLIGIILKNL